MDNLPRTMSMSRSGQYVALRVAGGVELVDALGASPRQLLAVSDAVDFCCVGSMLWVLRRSGTIARYALTGLRAIQPDIVVGEGMVAIAPAAGTSAAVALVGGRRSLLVHARDTEVSVIELPDGPARFPLLGQRLLVAGEDLQITEPGRGRIARIARPANSAILAATSLFDGRALAVILARAGEAEILVLHTSGDLIHRIAAPLPSHWAIAEDRGLAVLAIGPKELVSIDLRYGRVHERLDTALVVDDLALDANGQFIAIAGRSAERMDRPVHHLPYTDFVAATRRVASGGSGPRDESSADLRVVPSPHGIVVVEPSPAVREQDAAAAPDPVTELNRHATTVANIEIPSQLPWGLGAPRAKPRIGVAQSGIAPYVVASDHVEDMLDVISARAGRAIAEAWSTGRLSVPAEDVRPFEREVQSLLGPTLASAPEIVRVADSKLAWLIEQAAARAAATAATMPLDELANEFALSATAVTIVLAVLAPHVRGEIARLYGVLANDEQRALVDRFLIEHLVGGSDPRGRSVVAAELGPDAPLLRYGVIRSEGDVPLFASLTVDPVLVDRLYGRAGASTGATALRTCDRSLEELSLPAEIKRDLVLALGASRPRDRPLRLVVRGRRGTGRHSLIAALADRIDHRVAAIDAQRLPQSAKLLAAGLRTELTRALLQRAIPVVSGLEMIEDRDAQELVREIVRQHPGPVIVRATPEGSLPIETGHLVFALPAPSESERLAFWRTALTCAALPVANIELLAERFRFAPGITERVIEETRSRRDHLGTAAGEDAGPMLLDTARQHVAVRLGKLATPVTRLARWEQVALADDILDSLKEFIARSRHRRTVYETWGFDSKMTTSRGLSALFYGPPGTGKSMVAGLIARELGLELYKVDLSRVVSKWIGETEKNLAEIFDAAEDGQIVILFDEADSLFAKRTEVKSSVDRYANLEVNYLLQRLDSFEGICILTTNLEGSVDQAFKRRMSLRLQFPFPDEDMRARLWAAHVPAELPTKRDFDYADLARRFPLSGGYIRNSMLRAAFLAAQEGQAVGQDHLIRAIHLEYRELGKLSTSGRIE